MEWLSSHQALAMGVVLEFWMRLQGALCPLRLEGHQVGKQG